MDFKDLPELVMDSIIKHCDGQSLIYLSETTQRWKDIIEAPSQLMSKVWESVCTNEIHEDFIIDIKQKLYPKYWLGVEICWKYVYKCWWQWRNVRYWAKSVKAFEKKTKSTSSTIKFSGDWVFIGTTHEGCIEAINYYSGKKALLHHCGDVKDIDMRCSPLYKDCKESTIIKGVEHDEVIINCSHSYIRFDLHTAGISTFPNNPAITCFNKFEELEVSFKYSPSRVCSLNVITGREKEIDVYEFLNDLTVPVTYRVWNGKIMIMDWKLGLVFTNYDFKFIEYATRPKALYNFVPEHHFHLEVMFELSNSCMKVYVNRKFKKYTENWELCSKITSVIYHSGVLFLGTDTGILYIYQLKSDEDLLFLDPRDYTVCIFVCSRPIIALDIKETIDKPIIAAATEDIIYILTME